MKRIIVVLCVAAFLSLSLGVDQSEAGWRRYRARRYNGSCNSGSCATASYAPAPCAGGYCSR